ncbi:MAG: spermidine/putrescine ABC transporter substrate-binding protein, partial [Acidaminococcaceae bacterium]|nr:spermidine/putrescine ABC transporter substrate-binding protein [Acidaminococcaceae bacterium]
KNKELAQQFINYLYEPKVSAKNYEYIGYNDPNLAAAPYHTEEFKNDPILKTARDYIGNSEWTDDVGDAIELYDRCWTELKTGK